MNETQAGRVVISYGKEAVVEAQGELWRCNLRRTVGRPVCGDYVRWRRTSESDGVIEQIKPRRNVLARPDYRAKLRPLAANIDLIVVVIASEPGFTRELIDRYLVLAASLEIDAGLWLGKSDLLTDDERQRLQGQLADYVALGYPVVIGSNQTGEGVGTFKELLSNGTSVLVGQSGVGKSSLVKTLLPDREIRIGELSHASGLGRHTTTETTLYHLPDGGELIDSPGIRTLRLGHLTPQQIADGFREFRPFIEQCRFGNCQHINEPGCAVEQASREGHIAPARLASYRAIVAAEERESY